MGTLMSAAKEIDELRFVKLSTKPLRAKQIVQRNGTTVVELENGSYWSPSVNGGCAYTAGKFSDELLRILVDLGKIPKAALKKHDESIVIRERYMALKDAAERMIRLCVKGGVDITQEQQRKLFIIKGPPLKPGHTCGFGVYSFDYERAWKIARTIPAGPVSK